MAIRRTAGAVSVAWCGLTAAIVMAIYRGPAWPVAVAISLIGPVTVWVWVTVHSSRSNLRNLVLAVGVGTAASAANTVYIDSEGCRADAMCGLNFLNPPAITVMVFVLACVVSDRAHRRAGRA